MLRNHSNADILGGKQVYILLVLCCWPSILNIFNQRDGQIQVPCIQNHSQGFNVTQMIYLGDLYHRVPVINRLERFADFEMRQRLNICSLSYWWLAMTGFNLLGPSDAIWRWSSWSTLVQVMICCLMAPSPNLNQCWLIICRVPWHSSEDIIIRRLVDTNQ